MNQTNAYVTTPDLRTLDLKQLEPHFPMVKRIAKHLADKLPAHIQFEDLLQAGVIGLMEAVSRFDPSHGTSVEQYAGLRVRGAMVDMIRSHEWLPRSTQAKIKKVKAAILQIENETGRHATDAEVAMHIGLSLDEYHELLQDMAASELFHYAKENEDLDAILHPDNEEIEVKIAREEMKHKLSMHIAALPEKEQYVLSFYYQEELTFQEIADIMGLTESRICQLHRQALMRLHARFEQTITYGETV